jgi:predicted PurR-regulated permease PerM
MVVILRQLLEPKVYSMNMAIHPLAWLVAAFIGMKTAGIIGIILAPFALVLLKGLYEARLFHSLLDYVNGKP